MKNFWKMNKRDLKKTILEILAEDNYSPKDISNAVLKYDLGQKEISFKSICRSAEVACGIGRYEVLSKRREPKIVLARSLVFTYYRKHSMTFEKIGLLFGKDHSTVHNGVGTLRNLLDVGDSEAMEANVRFCELVK